MTPEERAAKLAREICACTCHGTKPAPADNSGPLKDGSHYANCPADDEVIAAIEIDKAIREAIKADREQTAALLNAAGVALTKGLGEEAEKRLKAMLGELATAGQGMFDKFAEIIRERPL